ncbi:hypothetical protein KL86DPRO_10817 [uncultured delta proteobacterium]|uniref:Uncharacterized protein n=1 Tax=uncultured delta proteobacterium TaxID=34034 RepID=A0A212J6P3_9DELT|nr:hypothetical protein KL86DPRO_10817 [uncultured delta proteobacterium]
MFADPFSAVMALILLAFIGTLAIFFRIWRELDALRRTLGDIRESLQYYAVDVAQQNRELANLAGELRGVTASRAASREASQDAQSTVTRDPADDCLGALLEKGLPNLVDNPSLGGGKPAYDFAPGSRTAFAEKAAFIDKDEEDFLRRFGTGPEKGPAS